MTVDGVNCFRTMDDLSTPSDAPPADLGRAFHSAILELEKRKSECE
jgi:hypothetical protein